MRVLRAVSTVLPLCAGAVLLAMALVAVPAAATSPRVAVDQCADILPVPGCWTTQDVIDPHIDSHAQTALMGMLTRGGADGAVASAILCAVKRRHLEGVYLPDQGVPALRVRSQGGNWWEMIPAGSHSVCYKPPPERAPLIAFSKQIKDVSTAVAAALTSAWTDCSLPATAPRCYFATITKPPTPVPPGGGDSGGGDTDNGDNGGSTEPPATEGPATVIIDLKRGGVPYAGKAQVFIANPDHQEWDVVTGQVTFTVPPGVYNTAARDYGLTDCKLGPATPIVVRSNDTLRFSLEVPECLP